MGLTRPDLDALPAYVPGRSIPGAIKLASNEVPYGPLPGVVEAVTAAAEQSHRYPDMGVRALRDDLSERLGVPAERILTGCGSVGLTEHLIRAVCEPGDEVVHAWRSFEAYPIITAALGVTGVRVPNLADHGHDLPAMVAARTDRTKMIIVCNPNNPTGTAVRRPAIDQLLAAVGPDVLVVFDEAYGEFVTDEQVPDAISTYGDRPNVAVLRTFSKAWGLAGLRAGYLVAAPEVASAVSKVITPFSTNLAAQLAARAALAAEPEMLRRVASITGERERLLTEVGKLLTGVPGAGPVPSSQANFVWLPVGARSAGLSTACEAAGVIVRAFPPEGVRVTVGTPDENDAFLAALARWVDSVG